MSPSDDTARYIIAPDPTAPRLTRALEGVDHTGQPARIHVVEERPLTIFLNGQEIVTAMTIGDYPEYLALGFLRNQGMLADDEVVTGVDYDDDLETVVVRTDRQTSYEEKLKKKTRTSGCAVGTVFGDMMEGLETVRLPDGTVRTSDLYRLAHLINRTPSRLDVFRRRKCRRQDALHHRAADLGDGDQDGVDGHSGARLALGLYRLGGGDCARGWPYADRADARAALCLPVGRGAAFARRRPRKRA